MKVFGEEACDCVVIQDIKVEIMTIIVFLMFLCTCSLRMYFTTMVVMVIIYSTLSRSLLYLSFERHVVVSHSETQQSH